MTKHSDSKEVLPSTDETFKGIVREPERKDLPAIRSIFEFWLQNMENGLAQVGFIMGAVEKSIDKSIKRAYLVAEEKGTVIGVIGMRWGEQIQDEMRPFAKTGHPAEIINMYVAPAHRGGKGVGTALLREIENIARSKHCTELLVTSDPKREETAWAFYKSKFGAHVGEIERAPDKKSPVWRKVL